MKIHLLFKLFFAPKIIISVGLTILFLMTNNACEKCEISAPAGLVYRPVVINSFQDMELHLQTIQDRVANFVIDLADDKNLHAQVVRSVAYLVNISQTIRSQYPNAMSGTFDAIISSRADVGGHVLPSAELIKLIDRFKDNLGPLLGTITSLETMAAQQKPGVSLPGVSKQTFLQKGRLPSDPPRKDTNSPRQDSDSPRRAESPRSPMSRRPSIPKIPDAAVAVISGDTGEFQGSAAKLVMDTQAIRRRSSSGLSSQMTKRGAPNGEHSESAVERAGPKKSG